MEYLKIDKEMLEILKSIVRQNEMIVRSICDPLIKIENDFNLHEAMKKEDNNDHRR